MAYNLRKKIKKEAIKKLYKLKGRVALCFIILRFVFILFLGLRCLLPNLFKIDFLSADGKFSTSFVIYLLAFWILYFLIISPMRCGLKRWYFKEAKSIRMKPFNIFYYFRNFKRFFSCISLKLIVALKITAFGILIFSPLLFILTGFIYTFNYASAEAVVSRIVLFLIIIVLFFLQTLFMYIFSLRYFMAEYFLAEELKVKECLKLSKDVMRDKIKEIFLIKIYFLILFILPFRKSYSQMTLALFACELTKKE